MRKIITYIAAILCIASCAGESESYDTELIIRTYEEVVAGEGYTPLAGCVAYAYAATKEEYTPASYDNALNGIITNTESGAELTPIATSNIYTPADSSFGEAIVMNITGPDVMLVVVDTKSESYAYADYEVGETLPTTYITLSFRPHKTSDYTQGKWTYIVKKTTLE